MLHTLVKQQVTRIIQTSHILINKYPRYTKFYICLIITLLILGFTKTFPFRAIAYLSIPVIVIASKLKERDKKSVSPKIKKIR